MCTLVACNILRTEAGYSQVSNTYTVLYIMYWKSVPYSMKEKDEHTKVFLV